MQPFAGVVLASNPIDPGHLLDSFGLIGLAIILFAECGLLIGFFLPGDTLLVTAGILVATGGIKTSLTEFLIVAPIAAIIGNLVGYWIGYQSGPHVFTRPQSRFFRPEYVDRSQVFFNRFGSWTILIARFVPIVRTVATVMAGVAKMRFALYALYSAIGGIVWTCGILLIGDRLGKIQFVQDNKGYLDYVLIAVVVISLLPTALHWLFTRRRPPAAEATGADGGASGSGRHRG